MLYLYIFIILILQICFYDEVNFKYSYNNELLLERIKRGKEALDETMKAKRKAEEAYKKRKKQKDDINNIYVKEIKCYEYVLDELNNLNMYNCSDINENNKSLLALAKTKCIFVKSIRDFPDEKSGCILNPKELTKIQLYLYNNNLLENFNDEILNSLNEKELHKIENIVNPCEHIENVNMSYAQSNINMLSSKNKNELNILTKNLSNEEIELNIKLCENLKYKIITNCTNKKNMSDIAFQIYHSELNHIDDICFYIQSTEWNKRTEENINRLSSTSSYITKQMTMNLENMKLIENAQIRQIENTNKFDMFIKTLKNDFTEIMDILLKIKKHHENVTKFLRAFKIAVTYLLILIFVLIVTSKNQASNSRKKLIMCVILCYITEFLFRKIINSLKNYIHIHIHPYTNYLFKGIRYSYLLIGIKILINTVITYKEPIKKIEEQLNDIKKIVQENKDIKMINNVINNEDTENILDNQTINIVNLWSSYNEYLENLYSDDSDYHLSRTSENIDDNSSYTSLASEQIKIKKCYINEPFIAERIKHMKRKKRPLYFHYIPSPNNIDAFLESPILFTEMILNNHEEIMKERQKRIKLYKDDNNNDTIIPDSDEPHITYNLSEIDNENEKINKENGLITYFSIDSVSSN